MYVCLCQDAIPHCGVRAPLVCKGEREIDREKAKERDRERENVLRFVSFSSSMGK